MSRDKQSTPQDLAAEIDRLFHSGELRDIRLGQFVCENFGALTKALLSPSETVLTAIVPRPIVPEGAESGICSQCGRLLR